MQVLGLVMAVCVVPHGFGGDRELVVFSMLYRGVGKAVDEEAEHLFLILARILKSYMGCEGVGTLQHASPWPCESLLVNMGAVVCPATMGCLRNLGLKILQSVLLYFCRN